MIELLVLSAIAVGVVVHVIAVCMVIRNIWPPW
jgi:hypothetical protein